MAFNILFLQACFYKSSRTTVRISCHRLTKEIYTVHFVILELSQQNIYENGTCAL